MSLPVQCVMALDCAAAAVTLLLMTMVVPQAPSCGNLIFVRPSLSCPRSVRLRNRDRRGYGIRYWHFDSGTVIRVSWMNEIIKSYGSGNTDYARRKLPNDASPVAFLPFYSALLLWFFARYVCFYVFICSLECFNCNFWHFICNFLHFISNF